MNYYKIAGAVMALDGFDYPYVKRRMSEYETSPCAADMVVTYAETDSFPAPKGTNTATANTFRKYFSDGETYAIYDALGDGYSAAIIFDKSTKTAQCLLKDIAQLGGAPIDIRCFNMLGELFRYFMLNNGGVVMHSSCIDYRGNGIIFSAPSGTGKSTHTGLWRKYYPDDVTVVNDDSPAIRIIGGIPHICGTPWSGKTDINTDRCVPLKAIVMLAQAKENSITQLQSVNAVFTVLEEISRPVFDVFFANVMTYLDDILKNVPVYRLSCDISQNAVETVKNTLNL